jgi:hypothetical protein
LRYCSASFKGSCYFAKLSAARAREACFAMNNNKNDEAALLAGCKGVFSKTSYITIGNKE